MGNKGKDAVVGHRHNNRVDMLRKGHAVHIGEDFLIVLKGFIKPVLLKFGDGKYFSIVHLVLVLVLCVKDCVELIMEFGDLPEESKAGHQKLLI